VQRAYVGSSLVLSALSLVLGLVLIASALIRGAGVLALGVVVGAGLTLAGAARLWLMLAGRGERE
jgi:hypothetical protein